MNQDTFRDYFNKRMVEMFQYGTLDSYRVRINNAMTILQELSNVLESWSKGNIKRFDTVELCLEECMSLLKLDLCLNYDFYNKDLFLSEMKEYIKKQKTPKDMINLAETKKIETLVNECIMQNDKCYFSKLMDAIQDAVCVEKEYTEEDFIPMLDNLELLLSSFGTELLRIGYSKERLFHIFKTIKLNKKSLDFNTAFSNMRNIIQARSLKNHIVIFKLRFSKEQYAKEATEKIDGMKEMLNDDWAKFINKNTKFKKCNSFTRLYIRQKTSLDSTSAARLAYYDIMRILDMKQDVVRFIQVPATAIVLSPRADGSFSESSENVYLIDKGKKSDKDDGIVLQETVEKINRLDGLSKDVTDRISAALRHLRIGDNQTEIEQKFINYWIGLEFIFASASSSESTYGRMSKYFITIMISIYIKRNLIFLDQLMKEKKLIGVEENYWNMTEEKADRLINEVSDTLLKYRLMKMKSHLHNSDKTKNYLKEHENRLIQNLERIYRLRNQLIHEAAIKETDISIVTSNLRTYLTFILNQLLYFFSNAESSNQQLEMNHFFWKYERCIRLIKERGYKRDDIMAAPIGNEIVK